MNFININGNICEAALAAISSDNRAFRYGYGIFETMLYQNGEIRLKELHWQRLLKSMQVLHFHVPAYMNIAWFEEEIKKIVAKNGLEKLARVRMQLYAGAGGLYDAAGEPEYTIDCYTIDEAMLRLNESGLMVGLAMGLQKSNNSIANIKTCNALIYILAARLAKERRWDDALLVNMENKVIESTIANIFWVKDSIVYTPLLSDGCVAGVMRQHVIETARKHGIGIAERSLDIETLLAADEVFLTNAIRGIKWIGYINDSIFNLSAARSLCQLILN